jgi:hypothetical protein
MTPAEKEQLWSCVMQMRSMPWKGPRGGTYNWTQREMRKLYEKIVVYGDNNQPDAAWRLLNSGKYKYMFYPWFRIQLYQCISFGPPPAIYTVTVGTPNIALTGTYEIYDVDTATTLVSTLEWETMFIDLQSLGYTVWGQRLNTTKEIVFYIETASVPNWEFRYDAGSGPISYALTFANFSSNLNTTKAYYPSINYSLASSGASSTGTPSQLEFRFMLSGFNQTNPSNPINMDNIPGLTKYFKAAFGPQAELIWHPDVFATDFTYGVCNTYDACPTVFSSGYASYIPLGGVFNTFATPTVCNAFYNTFTNSFPYPSGYTVNGLNADDPAVWATLAAAYNGYAYQEINPFIGTQTIHLSLNTSFTNLPQFDIGPGSQMTYYPYPTVNTAGTTSCIQTVIPAAEQYLYRIQDVMIGAHYFFAYLGGPLDLADNAGSSAYLTSLFTVAYGPTGTVDVVTLPSGDYEITIKNHWYPPPYAYTDVTTDYVYTNYNFSVITCP